MWLSSLTDHCPWGGWPCWDSTEVWLRHPPCLAPEIQTSLGPTSHSPALLRSGAVQRLGREHQAAWVEAILGTGYQGRNWEPEVRLPGSQPLSSQVILFSAHNFLTLSFLPLLPSRPQVESWSKVRPIQDAEAEGLRVRIIIYTDL